MRILLINAPTAQKYSPIESLGLGYLAAGLRIKGYQVEILDTDLIWGAFPVQTMLQKVMDRLDQLDYDLVGLTAIDESYSSAKCILEYLGSLKHRKDFYMTMGGYLATFAHEKLMSLFPQIDFIIRGEGDYSFIQMVDALSDGREVTQISGLSYRDGEQVIQNPNSILISDLNQLPFPARDNIRHLLRTGQPVAISTSRGCEGHCTYCAIASFYRLCKGADWRSRSAESVVEEIERIHKDYQFEQFIFVDDEFIGNEEGQIRAMEIADELIRRNLKIKFEIFCRSDNVEKNLMLKLKEVGLKQVFLGVESSLDQRLKMMGKGISSDMHTQAMNRLDEWKIDYIIGFIPMDPFSTIDQVKEEFIFLEKQQGRPYFHGSPSILSKDIRVLPYYGTPFQKLLHNRDLLKGDFPNYDYDFEDSRTGELFTELNHLDAKEFDQQFIVYDTEIPNNFQKIAKFMLKKIVYQRRILELEFVQRLIDIIKDSSFEERKTLIKQEKDKFFYKLKNLGDQVQQIKQQSKNLGVG